MRIIELGTDAEKAAQRFDIILSCAFLGRPPVDLESARNLGKLQDVLEDSSTLDGGQRKLTPGVERLIVDDGPYDLLKSRFFGAEVPWVPAANRRVLDAYDAVVSARVVTADDLKDTATASPAQE